MTGSESNAHPAGSVQMPLLSPPGCTPPSSTGRSSGSADRVDDRSEPQQQLAACADRTYGGDHRCDLAVSLRVVFVTRCTSLDWCSKSRSSGIRSEERRVGKE